MTTSPLLNCSKLLIQNVNSNCCSNFYIPLIGWAMPLNDYIPVTRGKKDSVLKMFSHCKTHLSNLNSVLFFPEGSRNTEGGLKFFKPGAFTLVFKISSFHFQ